MTIKQALQLYSDTEIELLLPYLLNKPQEFLYIHPATKLTTKQDDTLAALIRRRKKGEPIAYILGYKNFYGLRFKVTADTLIPRPETEWLVERVVHILRANPTLSKESVGGVKKRFSTSLNQAKSILDLGTGSGCMAISIKKHLPHIKVVASDISKKALAVARANARTHKVKIAFKQSNLLNKLGNEEFDIIVANFPYVPVSDYKKLYKGLKFEPKTALTDDTNRFILFEKFFQQVAGHLKPKARIALEIDPKAKPYITRFVKKYLPQAKLEFYRDLNTLWRFAIIKTK